MSQPSVSYSIDREGNYTFTNSITAETLIDIARTAITKKLVLTECLSNPSVVRNFLILHYGMLDYEVFSCLFLNSNNYLLHHEVLFRGTVDGATVYPREVVRHALKYNATSVIFAHNHPSGETAPSQADIAITDRLKKALDMFDIRVLDHFIVGRSSASSLSEYGLM